MPCGLLPQALNLLLLAALFGSAVFYEWPLWQDGSILSDTSSRLHLAGVVSSGVACLSFILILLCGGGCFAGLACLAVASEIASYVGWRSTGDDVVTVYCNGATSAASTLAISSTVSSYIQCDARWMPTLLWVLIALSSALQLLVAFFSLGVCGKAAVGVAAAVALEPGKQGRGKRRRRGRYTRVEGDERREGGNEEAGVALRMTRTTGRGGEEEEEEEAMRDSFEGSRVVRGERRENAPRVKIVEKAAMACGVIAQIANLVALFLLVVCTIANQWSSISTLTFDTSNISSLSQTVGCVTSMLALIIFPVVWMTGLTFLACVTALLAVVDVVCCALWSYEGLTNNLCSGAEATASDLDLDVSTYLQCDAAWMQYVLWGLVCISGSLQLSVAMSAINFGGGGSANELAKSRKRTEASASTATYAQSTYQQSAAAVARSLGKRLSRSSGRSKTVKEERSFGDEEAQLPLQKVEGEMAGESSREDSEDSEEEELRASERGRGGTR